MPEGESRRAAPAPEPPDPPPLSAWDVLLDEDAAPLDAELLAAYTEGRLGEAERRQVRARISQSPRAMDLLDGLKHDLWSSESSSAEATDESDSETADETRNNPGDQAAVPSVSRPAAVAYRRTRAPQRWLLAASVLLAAGMSFWAVHSWRTIGRQRDELARLAQTADERGRQLALAHKERLAVLSTVDRLPLVGTTSPALVRLALADSASRSIDEPPPEARLQQVREAHGAALQAAALLRLSAADSLLEHAALELLAGRLDEARHLAQQAQQVAGPTPQTLNLRAAVLLAQAMQQLPDEASRTLDAAAALLLQAVEQQPDFALAWFNLALLREVQRDLTAARAAWQQYLRHEPDAALRDLVRAQRGLE
jgi:tetratricopeptide (TPR) repeat protein